MKHPSKEVRLTAASASLLYALFAFERKGEWSSLSAAGKLAYFVQRRVTEMKAGFSTYTHLTTPAHPNPETP